MVTVADPVLYVAAGGGIENPGSFGSNDPNSPGSNEPKSPGSTGAIGPPTSGPSRYWQPLNTRATPTNAAAKAAPRIAYRPLYACRPLNQSDPEYVTSTIPNPTTSRSAAGRPAHERWLRAWR